MEILLNRYRNITALVLVLAAQVFLLAYQVKSKQDVRLIRVWAVSGILPLARLVDVVRSNTVGLVDEYAELLKARNENRQLKQSVDTLKLENQFLKTELATSERGRALSLFVQRSPSRLVAARIVGTGTGAGSKVVFVDRGSRDGVQKGMAVITPHGIVGRVTASYPAGAQVVLITDPSFAAGVISQKHRVHGTLKGQGHGACVIEYIQNEEPVETGEWFYTSGDDRVFPKGLPVGQVRQVSQGKLFFKEIFVQPSGMQGGLEEVLIVLAAVHQQIPETPDAAPVPQVLPPPPPDPRTGGEGERVIRGVMSTDADTVLDRYKRIGTAQGHAFGAGGVPNFNLNPPAGPAGSGTRSAPADKPPR